MSKLALRTLGFLLLIPPGSLLAQASEPKTQETWQVAELEGVRAGYVRTSFQPVERDGQKLIRATTELNLTIRRGQNTIKLRMESGDEETPEGKVTSVFMHQFQNNAGVLQMRGVVDGEELEVFIAGQANMRKRIPWNPGVIGQFKQESLFQHEKVKPGSTLTYASFEPTLNSVVTNRVTVADWEEVKVRGGKKERLLRVESMPDRIQAGDAAVQLPGLTSWLNKDLVVVRSQFELPMLGKLVLSRATKEEAIQAPGAVKANILDLLPLNRFISRANDAQTAVFRIRVRDEQNPETTFVRDDRQLVKNIQGDTFELHLRAMLPSAEPTGDSAAKPEYLESCFYVNSDDPVVQRLARAAVGSESDPWLKALRIEHWVHSRMTVSNNEPFAPAGEVARNLRGDCRQHGLLTTAMCRAVGVPSRTAIGLCYGLDRQNRPGMAFHMWSEVFVRGQWVGIDATRGEGHVGATHLKITDSSWKNEQSLTPLLPVVRVMGKLTIQVVEVDGSR